MPDTHTFNLLLPPNYIPRSKKYLLLTGVAYGIGLDTKYTMAPVLIGFIMFLTIYPRCRKQILDRYTYYAVLLALLFFAPAIEWNAQHDSIDHGSFL